MNYGVLHGDKQETGNRIVSNFIADFLWKQAGGFALQEISGEFAGHVDILEKSG